MTQLKWLVLMGAAAFVICTGMSLFLPPPPNPARHAALAIEERMPIPADTQALLKRACTTAIRMRPAGLSTAVCGRLRR